MVIKTMHNVLNAAYAITCLLPLLSAYEYRWQLGSSPVVVGHRLDGVVSEDFPNTYTLIQCATNCLRRYDTCRSFNYASRLRSCQLNRFTRGDSDTRLEADGDFSYFDRDSYVVDEAMLGVCHVRKPCGNGGSCVSAFNSNGQEIYHCICADKWTGKHCEIPVHEHVWSEWSVWGVCSASCGGKGYRTRQRRYATTAQEVTSPRRVERDYEHCNKQPCPRWQKWGDWSACSTRTGCGVGHRRRLRTCSHNGTVNVDRMCKGRTNETRPCQTPQCDAFVRLEGGSSEGEGRVMVFDNIKQQWGAVCSANWRENEANVVCRQLGYSAAAVGDESTVVDHSFGPYTGAYVLSDVRCAKDDKTLANCSSKNWINKCSTNSPGGVRCVVDGGFDAWTQWSGCSVTCADGIRTRTRQCTEPHPLRGGKDCEGKRLQEKACTEIPCPVDGEWRPWSEWGRCSVSCGGGMQWRNRICHEPKHNGLYCEGNSTDWRSCNTHHCPVDGYWLPWSEWHACNVTCGGGLRMRNRTCNEPLYGGADCEGRPDDWSDCNTHNCPIDGYWLTWSEWHACNTTCGGGWRMRNRTCNKPLYGGADCEGRSDDWSDCNTHHCPIDGYWLPWSEWHACNVTCGGGLRMRNRTCNQALYGGADCEGRPDDWSDCNTHYCPIDGYWLPWSEWTTCTVTCGGGRQMRNRTCVQPKYGGATCPDSGEDWRDCGVHKCPVDGEWNSWFSWSACSVTCANGTRTRSRVCQQPKHGGMICMGDGTQIGDCYPRPCPIDGTWNTWGEWLNCSAPCGDGLHSRYRTCKEPLYGGADCQGNNNETRACFVRHCPVDGVWEDWSDWTDCTKSCGEGTQTRKRQCTPPRYGGKYCDGPQIEGQTCNPDPCPEDGFWDPWSLWQKCSVTCGGGMKWRNRTCNEAKFGGNNCTGPSVQSTTCNNRYCPVDGVWQEWSDWRSCNVSCGGGYQSRHRDCIQPRYGGETCKGDDVSWQRCNDNPCPVDGMYGEWSRWFDCSVTCGGGSQRRYRVCGGILHGGLNCTGEAEQYQECNTNHCPIDGVWNPWSPWGNCSEWCGNGLQVRNRTCHGPFYNGNECSGPPREERFCFERECPIDGVWAAWGEWQQCSDWCGNGTQNRTRQCDGPFYGGSDCPGDNRQQQGCFLKYCPIDGIWESWSSWTECSLTCANGTQTRHRVCDGPFYEGRDCEGEPKQTQGCFVRHCPVDGVWAEWSEWGVCSTSCSNGTHSRSRTCDGPFYDGRPCEGEWNQTRGCFLRFCPVDGFWQTWEAWNTCDVTCGGGTRTRARTCEQPKYGGAACPGKADSSEICNTNPCPIPGDWMSWGAWDKCSQTCGSGGTRFRSRVCDMNSYGNLTAPCLGDDTMSGPCNKIACLPQPQSCGDMVRRGIQNSDWIMITPDDITDIWVYCDMDGDNADGVTVMHHDMENGTQVRGFEGVGEYSRRLIYRDGRGQEIPIASVIALVDGSAQCRQFISWKCRSATINARKMNDENVIYRLTYWTNRKEKIMDYWGGTTYDRHKPYIKVSTVACACSNEGSECAVKGQLCNCDKNDNVWREDSGYLTEKKDLPVRSFHAGDTGAIERERGVGVVGGLICAGVSATQKATST